MVVKDITAKDLREMIQTRRNEIEIVDVREPEETRVIRLKGSKLIPMNELQGRIDEINWSKEVVFICRSGVRSRVIAEVMSQKGKNITNLKYGIHECYFDKKDCSLEIGDENLIRGYF